MKKHEDSHVTGYYKLDVQEKIDLELLLKSLNSVLSYCLADALDTLGTHSSNLKPNTTRQRILRELGFIQLLFHFLDVAFPDEKILAKVSLILSPSSLITPAE